MARSARRGEQRGTGPPSSRGGLAPPAPRRCRTSGPQNGERINFCLKRLVTAAAKRSRSPSEVCSGRTSPSRRRDVGGQARA